MCQIFFKQVEEKLKTNRLICLLTFSRLRDFASSSNCDWFWFDNHLKHVTQSLLLYHRLCHLCMYGNDWK